MALVSPGVQVTVIDESFYTPAEPGTTPLIVVASGQDKNNAAGTGTAIGTTAANAGRAFKITSQRELVDTFGVPFFEKSGPNPVHGGERNEYGLLAAYSYLGSSSSAFIVRANIDLDQLAADSTIPGSEPLDGQWWVSTIATSFGVQEWNAAAVSAGGQKFVAKTPIVITDDEASRVDTGSTYRAPKSSVGAIGDYAVVFETVDGPQGTFNANREYARLFYKSSGNSGAGITAGTWVLVGSPEWCSSHPTVAGSKTVTSITSGHSLVINGTTVSAPSTSVSALATAINNASITGVSAAVVSGKLYIYSDGSTEDTGDSARSGRINIANGTGTLIGAGATESDVGDLGIVAGVYLQPKLQQSPHTSVPLYKRTDQISVARNGYPTGSLWVKTTNPGAGADWIVNRWNSGTQAWVNYSAPLYASGHAANYYLDRSGGGRNIAVDSIFVQHNATENYSYASPDDTAGADSTLETAEFRVWRRSAVGATTIKSSVITSSTLTTGNKSFSLKESLQGGLDLGASTLVSVTLSSVADPVAVADAFATAINAAGFTHVEAAVTANNELQISHKAGGDFRIIDTNGAITTLFPAFNLNTGTGTAHFFAAPAGSADDFIASNWTPLSASDFIASSSEPLNEPQDGQLWYNPEVSQVDIMVHDGDTWVGYANEYPTSDPAGPQVAATAPTTQSDGSDLVTGDLWISTADLENFPTIYKFNAELSGVPVAKRWVEVDKADQITEDGVLFADARWDDTGESTDPASIVTLLSSDFLDPDAPDSALYPKGMLLWNTRRSYGNVKRYVNNYIDQNDRNPRYATTPEQAEAGGQPMTNYATDRWVTASPNNEDGSGTFRRHAQRAVVQAGIKSVIDTSSEIRDEERRNFNLIACPGYPEVMQNLINLNIDRGLTAFVIGDTPLRLAPDATTLTNWGTNAAGVTGTGDDGITAYDEYLAIYYPNGFTNDLSGANAVVPASHMMLKTMALSDQVSYPWFAPAGTRRGGIVNATSVGYIDSLSGEFQTVQLGEGQRDTLYDLKINPIPFFVGVGHVAFGQKTRARNASALDRINVARLVVYLRSQLNKLARPYLFEPNDQITRDEIKGAVESLLLELVGLRAIYDFVVVCDESNNTPSRVDRNELYVDIAIEPTKAVEFIYIPLRLKNTGEI